MFLKKCAFCKNGNDDDWHYIHMIKNKDESFQVVCQYCSCSSPTEINQEDADEMWNSLTKSKPKKQNIPQKKFGN